MDDLREQWRGYVGQSKVMFEQSEAAYWKLAQAEPPVDEADLRVHVKLLEKARVKRDFAERSLDNAVTHLALLDQATD